jgi:hypothetical protein
MWNMKCFVKPVIIGAMAVITKWLKKVHRNSIMKAFKRFSTKKTAVLGTLHIIRKVL